MKLIIHAPNVHRGGGRTLLHAVLQGIDDTQACLLLADDRLGNEGFPVHIAVEHFPATLCGRFAAERRLRDAAQTDDVVLCMGNLPPLLPCKSRVAVFLQNRYLTDALPLAGFSLRSRLRIAVERLWLRARLHSGVRLIVQTPSMQSAVRQHLGFEAIVLPFFPQPDSPAIVRDAGTEPRFIYPASAEPHKNHRVLLAAWRLLDEWSIRPELHLTVETDTPLGEDIQRARNNGLAVINHGPLDTEALAALYAQCSALVYPSKAESFGLPLLEARQAGLRVVAAELDYVRDVVVPDETFDPDSPLSIARAVRRLLHVPERPQLPARPEEFIRQVVSGPW